MTAAPIRRRFGVYHRGTRHPDCRARRIVELEYRCVEPLALRRIGVVLAAVVPDRPQAVDVGMVDPEQRVKTSSVESAHETSHHHVNVSVRGRLEFPHRTAAVIEPHLRSSEPGGAPESRAHEDFFVQAIGNVNISVVRDDAPSVRGRYPLLYPQRIRAAVWELLGTEGRRDPAGIRIVLVAVIPVRQ